MRKRKEWLYILAMLVILSPLLASMTPTPAGVAQAQTNTTDDEIVVLKSNGQIQVYDPHQMTGHELADWTSTSTGWQKIALGDFNGDGEKEILAISGSTAKVFDPVVPPGGTPVSFQQSCSPYTWELAAAGDIDNDGRDEIVLTRTDNAPGNIKEHITVWDGNADGTSWTKIKDMGFGDHWGGMAVGDINGDNLEDIALFRNSNPPNIDHRIVVYNPATWTTLVNNNYNFTWLSIAIGNIFKQSGTDYNEVATTRGDVLGERKSFLVFRYPDFGKDVWGNMYYPYFTDIALGDVDGDGADEVFLVRDPVENKASVIGLDCGGTECNVIFSQAIGRSWRGIAAGDLDGDGKAEVALVSSTMFRYYTDPANNNLKVDVAGSFKNQIAVGDIDGAGIVHGPTMEVTPTSIDLSLNAGDTATRYFTVKNVGDDTTFTWTAEVVSGSDWMTVVPTTGQASQTNPGEGAIQIDTRGMLPGTYNGTVRITASSGIADSPQDIAVILHLSAAQFNVSPREIRMVLKRNPDGSLPVYPPPQISVTGSNVQWVAGVIPGRADSDLLQRLNSSPERVRWTDKGLEIDDGRSPTVVPVVDWLDISPDQGTTPSTIFLHLVSSISSGMHNATVIVDGGPGVAPRFYGVDVSAMVAEQQVFIPMFMR